MRRLFVLMVSTLWLATAVQAAPQKGAPAASKRVVCWTDEHGQRACGDRVPPQYSQKERQIFDAQGRVVQTKPREKTADEVAAEEDAKKRAELLKVDEQKAHDYDRFLLTTFDSVQDIERARDERITILEGRTRMMQRSIDGNEQAIASQKRRIAALQKNNKLPDDKQIKKLADLEKTMATNRHSLAKVQDDLAQTRIKYNADIERYEALRAARR